MLAEMCASTFEKNIGGGRRFGMAFGADQQGYPGPIHVLELKDRNRLLARRRVAAVAAVGGQSYGFARRA